MLSPAKSEDFKFEVLEHDSVVVADFYADWCGPCRVLMQILNEVSEENPDVKFVKINVDENKDLATGFEIRNLPTLLVFNKGKVVAKNVGSATKFEIRRLIENV
jgi:thioredoxin 1